jgi:SNF2 family DNA or RNA helicase
LKGRGRMIQTKKDVLRFEAELKGIQTGLESFTEDRFDEKIKESWEPLKFNAAKERLQTMPVDTISTLERGMPINSLVNHGFKTIYDIRNESVEDLRRIDGIGIIGATAIYEAASKIITSVYEEAIPKINPDQLSIDDLALLESIYRKWKLTDAVQSLKEAIGTLSQQVGTEIQIAKRKKGFLGGLFQSKAEKEQVEFAFRALNQEAHQATLRKAKKQFVHIHQFAVDPEQLRKHFIEKNAAYYTEIEYVIGFDATAIAEDLSNEIIQEIQAFPLDTTGLKLDLRHYQTFGAKYALHYKRTLLGDEMGLGKTIQALALINHLFQNDEGYSIVVCPLSVLANWKREIEQHSNLNAFIFHGNQRATAFTKWQEEKGVLLTTYEQTFHLDMENLTVNALIVDEAHYVKNPDAKRSKSVYQLASLADYALFMSGTPLENRLEEMKQLIAVLQPDIAELLSKELHLLHPTEFRKTVASVYLRRNRKDVLKELPELEIIPQWMDFGEKEELEYEQAVNAGKLMSMRRAAWLGGTPETSPKLQKLLDICEEAYENGHKVLVFSFFRDVIRTVEGHLEGRTFEPITGDVPNHRRQDIIDEFTNADPGAVLISQITAGGVGLNIQAANIVILCEPQWKPSIEEQAISRAYRMGQSRNVVVYRLLTEDSIDVSILELLGQKAGLFDLYARESEVGSLALNNYDEGEDESLKQKVLQLEKERLKEKVG